MKRSEIRDFVRAGVEAMSPVLDYKEGLFTDWNANQGKQYPGVLLELEETITAIPTTNSAPYDLWPIKLLIGRKDHMDSTPDIYEALVDQCDEVAQRLVYKYRAIISGYKLVTIESIKRLKFVKRNGADCISGIELTFEIKNQDQTNVC